MFTYGRCSKDDEGVPGCTELVALISEESKEVCVDGVAAVVEQLAEGRGRPRAAGLLAVYSVESLIH